MGHQDIKTSRHKYSLHVAFLVSSSSRGFDLTILPTPANLRPIQTICFVSVRLRSVCVPSKCVCAHTTRLGCSQSACSCCSGMAPRKFSVKELTAIALLLHEDENRVKAKQKRLWVHKCQKKRRSEGEFWTLYKELDDDETKFFFQYFRMSKSLFNYLLHKV